jgi:hypothetical protein
MERQVGAYRVLAKSARSSAVETFEPLFFNNLVLVLEGSFAHRLRGREGKDGNALNEVRMLSQSILQNGGVLARDATIRYDARRSVLKLAFGDEIRLNEADFVRLCRAYFSEIERRFT